MNKCFIRKFIKNSDQHLLWIKTRVCDMYMVS